MRTLEYPDGDIPSPYYYNSDDDSHTLFLVFIILLIAILCYIFYIFKKGIVENNVITTCPIGFCATALEGGGKRCPQQLDEIIYANPGTEVCNPPNLCTSPQTPYALNPWGETLINGICPNNQICGCVNVKSCPLYSMVVFIDNGDGGILTQQTGNNVSTGGQSTQLGKNESCTLDTTSLNRVGCTSYQGNILECVQSNPCLAGIFSYIPPPGMSLNAFVEDPTNFINSPLTCVPGKVCKSDEVSVYNSITNVAICVPLQN